MPFTRRRNRQRRSSASPNSTPTSSRVIEDVIDTSISKNVINITDLPIEAQVKLFSRKSFRERASKDAPKLFGD